MATAKLIEEKLTIHMVFGSEMQRDVSMKILNALLNEWRQSVEDRHQKNKISITEG
jgi:hypothetical protein